MRLSQSATYAIYGLQYLAKQPPERGPVPVKEVAKVFHFPEKHLAKIFQGLVRSRLLRSDRGVGGGFRLGRPASEINLLDIIEAIEGPLMPQGCIISQGDCTRLGVCPVSLAIHEAQKYMIETFQDLTLDSILENTEVCPRMAEANRHVARAKKNT